MAITTIDKITIRNNSYKDNLSLLESSIYEDDLETIYYLLHSDEIRVKPNISHIPSSSPENRTLLMEICYLGKIDILKLIFLPGGNYPTPNIDYVSNRYTALMWALENEQFKIVNYLLSSKDLRQPASLIPVYNLSSDNNLLNLVYQLNAIDYLKKNKKLEPIFFKARNNDMFIYEYAIDSSLEKLLQKVNQYNINLNNTLYTCFRYACIHGNINMLKELQSQHNLNDIYKITILIKNYVHFIDNKAFYKNDVLYTPVSLAEIKYLLLDEKLIKKNNLSEKKNKI